MCTLPVVEGDDFIDLIAFRLDRPGRWWVRTGSGVALGMAAIDAAADAAPLWKLPGEAPPPILNLYQTPLSWLRAGGGGAVILNPRFYAYLLGGIGQIQAEDEHHARQLHNAGRRSNFPRILLAKRAA